MVSEFPRHFIVSSVLMIFLLILVSLAGEIGYFLLLSIFKSGQGFNLNSLFYFMAYLLANLLFLLHIFLYFGFRERVEILPGSIRIKQKIFLYRKSLEIMNEQIFFYRTCQSFMGNYHLEIYYFDQSGKTRKAQFGSYLEDEEIIFVNRELEHLRF